MNKEMISITLGGAKKEHARRYKGNAWIIQNNRCH